MSAAQENISPERLARIAVAEKAIATFKATAHIVFDYALVTELEWPSWAGCW